MSMHAQYPPHPLSRKMVHHQTPRKNVWRMAGTAAEEAKAAALIEAQRDQAFRKTVGLA